MFSKIATESLSQRGRSAFYTALVSFYQKIQDALYGLENPSDGQITKLLDSLKVKEELKALLIKFTNMPIRAVVIERKPIINLMCTVTGNDKYKHKEMFRAPVIGMLTETLNHLYDDRKGKLTEKVSVIDSPFVCILHLYSGLFKAKNKDKTFYLTAEELAAGTLHEIGHVDFFIRNFLRAQNRIMDASDIIEFLKTAPDNSVFVKTIDVLLNNKRMNQEWGKVLKTLREEFLTANQTDLSKIELISTITTILTEDISARQLTLYNQSLGYDKSTRSSSLYQLDNERSADEYATRHGAAAALISLVTKMDKMYGPDYDKFHVAMYGSEANLIVKLLVKFNEKMSIKAEEIHAGYDPLIRRLELIVETAKHAFHDDALPVSVIPELKRDIVEAEQYLNQYRQADYRSSRLRLKKWKDNITSFGRIIASPFIDRLGERYDTLHDANRSLSRHSLYYLAKK